MAKAMRNPPSNKNTIGSAYGAVVAPTVIAPVTGNTTMGNNDVTGIGIASVTHQMITHAVPARMAV